MAESPYLEELRRALSTLHARLCSARRDPELFLHSNTVIFLTSALALIPLAGLLGEATEELAIHTGPKDRWTIEGNAAELIITIVALRAGQYELVKASITGSIIGNLLLILGFALLLGSLWA